jgi:hypothetical protein
LTPLLGLLASNLEDDAEAMERDGFPRLAEQVRLRAEQAKNPQTWCEGVTWDEDDEDEPPAVRVAKNLADGLPRQAASWAEVFKAKHREDVLKMARAPVPTE